MTVRLMFDGINSDAAAIRQHAPDAPLIAYYIDGKFAWSAVERNLFPHANHVTITVLGGNAVADVVDCEAGDTNPDSAAAWVRNRHAAGYARPTIYCSRSVIPAVRAATGALVLGKDYDIWCADYTGTAHQVTAPGTPAVACPATQYANMARWDVSAVYDDGWPHRTAPAPHPVPAPTPAPAREQDMIILRTTVNGATVTYTYNGSDVKHVVSPPDQAALAAVLPVVDVSAAQVAKFNGGQMPPM